MSTPEIVEDVLTHFGKKGMRWGQRTASGGAQKVSVTNKGKKLKTSGGKGFPAHSDAVRARTLGQVGKKSGVKALSNNQLKTYSTRLNMEQNAKRLMYEDSSLPSKFIKTLLGQTGRKTTEEVSSAATKQAKSAVISATKRVRT